MPDKAVSNSGPLIHLSQINKFELLKVFPKIYIPTQVYHEVTSSDASLKDKIDKARNIEKAHTASEELDQLAKKRKKHDLDPGELHAIYLCDKLKGKLFLTDDLDAREAAEELGLEPHGSVGIIVLAYRKKYLELKEAEKAIYDLYDISNLYISRAVVDIGLAELRKHK